MGGGVMGRAKVITLRPPRRDPVLPEDMTHAQLVQEFWAQERQMADMETALASVADAVWPEGTSERPDEPDAGFTAEDIRGGIASLHELVERLYAEHERAASTERERIFAVLRRASDVLRSGDPIVAELIEQLIEEASGG